MNEADMDEIYKQLIESKDIKELIDSRMIGLRADEDHEIELATKALADIGSEAIPSLLEALDEFALDARIAVTQQRYHRGVFASMEMLQNSAVFGQADIEIQRRLDNEAPLPCYPPALALVKIGIARESVIWALGELGDRTLIPELKKIIRFLRRDRVSKAAKKAIGKIENKA